MALERGNAHSVGAIQGAESVTITNASINVVGGDSYSTHIYALPPIDGFEPFWQAIDNHRRIQQDILAKATPGTVEWMFEANYFATWWDGKANSKVLWGSGMPGAGKTVLTSIVIHEMERRAAPASNQICVVYFYMRYNDHAQTTVRDVLEVFVKQALERNTHLLPLARRVYSRHISEKTRPTEEELLGLLKQLAEHIPRIICFFDALDEAPADIQYELVDKLVSLDVRVFITSRPIDLRADFPGAHHFDITAQDQDLDVHISQKLQKSGSRLRKLLSEGDGSLMAHVISVVKSKCGGMFLHASLQLDALQRCLPSSYSVKTTLEQFPVKIEDVYQTTWTRIINLDPDQASLAQIALLWVIYAHRSLTIKGLLHALATCPKSHGFEEERLVPASTITDACQGLLVVDEESRLVRLIHYTAKEPLKKLLIGLYPSPHSLLAAVCIARLSDCGFQNSALARGTELQAMLEADPLLEYAYNAWDFHARESLSVEATASRLSSFLANCHRFPNMSTSAIDFLNPLHMVAFYTLPISFAGSNKVVRTNSKTGLTRRTPLHMACGCGNDTGVQSLLCLPDMLVNLGDRFGETPLAIAARNGYTKVVKILLAYPSIQVNLAHGHGQTPLMAASRNGQEETVKLLLAQTNIDVNAVAHIGTALILASERGHVRIVNLLLAVPEIDINSMNGHGETAIKRAAQRGNERVVRVLLQAPGVNITHVSTYDGHTAISAAAERGYGNIVKLLEAFKESNIAT